MSALLSTRSADRLAVRHARHLSLSGSPTWSCGLSAAVALQGTRDLNPQPSVLETDALPVELVPSGIPYDRHARSRAWLSMWETTKRGVYGEDRGRVQTAGLRAGRRRHRAAVAARLRWCHDLQLARPARSGPANDASPDGSAPSPSPRRSRSTPRPRRSRPRAARSSASAPASPTSRRPATSWTPRSRPAATRGTTATPPRAGCPSSRRRSPTRRCATAASRSSLPRCW